MKEIWKDIPEYEGLYQASNLGRIKRILFINRNVIKKQEKTEKKALCKASAKCLFSTTHFMTPTWDLIQLII